MSTTGHLMEMEISTGDWSLALTTCQRSSCALCQEKCVTFFKMRSIYRVVERNQMERGILHMILCAFNSSHHSFGFFMLVGV